MCPMSSRPWSESQSLQLIDGRQPATCYGSEEITQILLDHNGHPGVTDKEGLTPGQIAVKCEMLHLALDRLFNSQRRELDDLLSKIPKPSIEEWAQRGGQPIDLPICLKKSSPLQSAGKDSRDSFDENSQNTTKAQLLVFQHGDNSTPPPPTNSRPSVSLDSALSTISSKNNTSTSSREPQIFRLKAQISEELIEISGTFKTSHDSKPIDPPSAQGFQVLPTYLAWNFGGNKRARCASFGT